MKKAICAIALCMCMSFSAAALSTTEESTTALPDVTTENTLEAMATTGGSTTLPPSDSITTVPTTEGQDDVTTTDGGTTASTTALDGEVTTDGSSTAPSTTAQDGEVTLAGSTGPSRTTIKNGRVTVKGSTTTQTTRPTVPLQTLYADGGVTLQAATGVFPQNTQITVAPLVDGHTALSSLAEKFTAYTITAQADTVTVRPRGTFTITVAIPADYTPRDTAVVLVGADGTPQILVSKVDAAARTVTAETNTIGIVAVAQLQTTGESRSWLTVLAVAGVAAAAVVGYLYFRKQKK